MTPRLWSTHYVGTFELTTQLLDEMNCVCGHPVHRHSVVYGVGCLVGGYGLPGGPCDCPLVEHEAKFYAARYHGGLAGGSVQVRRVDGINRFIRGSVDHTSLPSHLRWFVRPHLRSNLFVLLPTWDDAIVFATRDWHNTPQRHVSPTEDGQP